MVRSLPVTQHLPQPLHTRHATLSPPGKHLSKRLDHSKGLAFKRASQKQAPTTVVRNSKRLLPAGMEVLPVRRAHRECALQGRPRLAAHGADLSVVGVVAIVAWSLDR